jgi:transcriptional regulator with XRE-family HTH domain
MESELDFDELVTRLRAYIRYRINCGEFTERSLARILRVSQPHLHNMLKGVRRVNIEFADTVMRRFKISVLDLIEDEELRNYLDGRNPDWLAQALTGKKPPALSQSRSARLPWLEEAKKKSS